MSNDGDIDFKLYRYDPSTAAAGIAAALFLIITTLHLYQLVRTKTNFFIPFLIGGIFQVVGYIARAINSTQGPKYGVPAYAVQSILILVAPALYAASIYMCLGRIILLTDGEAHSLIKKKWLTKIFVMGDVVSFMMQAAGGGIMASGSVKSLKTGENVIIAGLVVQLLFFGFFIVVGVLFDLRMHAAPTRHVGNSWHKHMWALYGGSALILIRSVFRLVEYAQGNDGYLISHEVFLYVFDSLLMLATMVLFAVVHPSEVQAVLSKTGGYMIRRVVGVERYRPVRYDRKGVNV